MANVPAASDIRDYLSGYDIDEVVSLQRIGNVTSGSSQITEVENADEITSGMRLESKLFSQGTTVTSVDAVAKTVDVDSNATANSDNENLTFVGFQVVTDSWIQDRIDNRIVPWVEEKTRLSFTGEVQEVEYHSGNGSTILPVNRKPIKSVDEIELIDASTETAYTVDVGQVEVLKQYGILKARHHFDRLATEYPVFPRGTLNIKVTLTYGYANDSIPSDVREALIVLTAEVVLGHIAGRTGGGSLSTQNFQRQFGKRGKYSEVRNDLARTGISILRKYMSGTVGA